MLGPQSISMTVGGATLLDAVDLRVHAGEIVAIVRAERCRQIDSCSGCCPAISRPSHGRITLKRRDLGFSAAPAQPPSRDAVRRQCHLPVQGRRDCPDGRRRQHARSLARSGRRGTQVGSGWMVSVTGNCRRCPAANSSGRILPACWCSLACGEHAGADCRVLDGPGLELGLPSQI